MQSKRILITGGAGFIGTNLSQVLIKKGYRVHILDDFSNGLKSNLSEIGTFELIEGSILNKKLVENTIKNVDTVVHLAAKGSVPRSIKDPQSAFEVNTVGTFNILEAIRKYRKSLIFSSSSSVYGLNSELPKKEKMWMQPISPYAASKLSAESLVSGYSSSYNLRTTTLRLFNVFGPYQRPNHEYAAVIPKWIWSALENEPIKVFGDGSATRDFTFVLDLVKIIEQILDKDSSHPTPINLAFGSRISLNDVIAHLKIRFPNIEVEFHDERPGDVKDSQNSPELLNQIFPNIYPTAFETALDSTIDWINRNSDVLHRVNEAFRGI